MPRPIYTCPDEQLSSKLTEHYDKHADRYWEEFYVRNDDRFFSDRHYLQHEFPELTQGPITVFEAGCGVGNTVFPVLEANPEAVAYACDFSQHAVSLVRRHAMHAAGRVHAFVADLTNTSLTDSVPAGTVDFCSLIFVLSAVDPSKMPQVLHNIAGTLKKGSGQILFRDYVEGDLAESRLAGSSRQQKLQDNFYVRGDGTRAFFFSQESLVGIFSEAGYACKAVHVHERTIENRRMGLLMDRRWIQAVFVYIGRALPASSAAGTISPRPPGHDRHTQQSSCQLDVNRQADQGSNRVTERNPEALAAEWEQCPAAQSADTAISHLFEDERELQEVQQHISLPGIPALSVHSVSRSHRHTLTHTGLMLWESAPALAAHLLANPRLLSDKQVMEVGAGGNPAVAFAALRHARRVVATEGSPQALCLLQRNVCANASLAVIERLRVRRLAWADAGHQASLQKEFGHFDLILGADVVYVDEAVPLLMASLAALLRQSAQSRVILCHITRGVSEGRIIEMASAAGLSLDSEGQLDGAVRMLLFKWQ